MDKNLCARCKGKNLCGKPFCTIVSKFRQFPKPVEAASDNFMGTTPPSCFVGRRDYPKVNLNILTPSYEDSYSWTRDSPSFWYGAGLDSSGILERRSGMVAVRSQVSVRSPAGRFLELAREVAQSEEQVDAEFWLKKKPGIRVSFDPMLAPIGSPAEVSRARLAGNVRIARPVDRAVSDTDLKATGAIGYLYGKGIEEGTITKVMSLGLLGLGKNRKLVPTRWTITAVDDAISKELMTKAKDKNIISDYLVFSETYLGNHFEILLAPREWQFEVIETKFPGSVWNPGGGEPVLYSDRESHFGRKAYASEVTGAYYSARLASLEYLERIKRQASVLILREVHPEYDAPLGVWVIREAVRGAFRKKPSVFGTLDEALSSMKARLKLPFARYEKESSLLRAIRTQRTLSSFA